MSRRPVISVENLGKEYVIGGREKGGDTFREMLVSAAAAPFRRLRRLGGTAEIEERIWALKGVSFTVAEGEVLGIIGRNGAGKSTLLKILSRITDPSEGRVEIRGRVASLLEIGTGFHPELTGRENIYLNGAILGMRRAEINCRFDEIVNFSGVEKFLDTPVKRYSSGMTVRLAFAVAAHLEPEILIVDEVLAVGDAEFQRRCLGKIRDVAGGGRTVLFVSHNMGAIRSLCEKVILVRDGRLGDIGSTSNIVDRYLANNTNHVLANREMGTARRRGAGKVVFRRATLLDRNGTPTNQPRTGDELTILLEFGGADMERLPSRLGIIFYDVVGTPLMICANEASSDDVVRVGSGDKIACRIPRLPLSAGSYEMSFFLERAGTIEDWLQDNLSLHVADGSFFATARNLPRGWEGKTVLVENEWWSVSKAAEKLASRIA